MNYQMIYSILATTIVQPMYEVLTRVYRTCRTCRTCRKKSNQELEPLFQQPPPTTKEEFLVACKEGFLNIIEKYLSEAENRDTENFSDVEEGLEYAIYTRDNRPVDMLVQFLARKLDKQVVVDRGLELSAKNNIYGLTEYFLQKGAKTLVGLRVSKSPNIIKLIYRYEQKSELIN